MKNVFFLFLLFLSLAACSSSNTQNSLSGTEAGNPSIIVLGRAITGTVPATADGCSFLTVFATNDLNTTTEADIQDDCSFVLDVEPDHLFKISFETPDGTLIDLTVDNNGEPASPYFVVSAAGTAINLGSIAFDGTLATPEFEPSQQNDQDGDGLSDYDDPDDNGDGVVDADEDGDEDVDDVEEEPLPVDTDLDGIPDGTDNCPAVSNPDQSDQDEDGVGDACEEEQDVDDCPVGTTAACS